MTAPLTHRLIPPANGGNVKVNGRTYSATAGAQDVPEFDATHLQANGWTYLAPSGPTTQRPTSELGVYPRVRGAKFWDATLSHMVIWDGANWRNEAGAIS
ncbi:hypothetical protein [Bradyrhizobium erythrophlei]|uniref:Uncharacterized protein n=1 Tax=Bradyrhizobium erythrophlei TaxID=1437360 RepID=A0A1M5NNV1_9BRAD|nr:hypothetical protein [Bradyrhizobium erythrophlei]SHG91254.1 hypothetical protein SAMN05443248_3065 [Bradyrhizobium erythrophlei]